MDRLISLKGEAVAVREMRKHLAWYLKGMKAAARVRMSLWKKPSVMKWCGY
ncbi:hypothetical protein D3C74_500510 [compost metagenome]